MQEQTAAEAKHDSVEFNLSKDRRNIEVLPKLLKWVAEHDELKHSVELILLEAEGKE